MRSVPPKKSTSVGYIYLQGKPNQLIPLKDKFKFGRSEIYKNSAVSRDHFSIAVNDGGAYYIIDLGSRTGTRVDGRQVTHSEWIELAEGSQITCGPYVFIFTIKQEHVVVPLALENKAPLELQKKVHKQQFSRPPSKLLFKDDHKNDSLFLAIISWSLIACYFFLVLVQGDFEEKINSPLLIKYGAHQPYLTASGEWWRLLTSSFFHADFFHLMGHVCSLYFVMAYILKYIPPMKTLAIYLGSIILTNIIFMFVSPVTMVTVGTTGALFGLYGAALVCLVKHLPEEIKLNMWLLATLAYTVYVNFIIGDLTPGYLFFVSASVCGAVMAGFCLWIFPDNDTAAVFRFYGLIASVTACTLFVLPVPKATIEEQMGGVFSMYLDIRDKHYENLSKYEKHRDIFKLEQQNDQVLKRWGEIDVFLHQQKQTDQKADYYKKQITYIINKSKRQNSVIMDYIKTNNKNEIATVQSQEKSIANYRDLLSQQFGVKREKSLFEKRLDAFQERLPATTE